MRLSAMADRASTGGAATWRIDATTLRRALDTGETGESLLAFLNAHSQTPVPPALEYLLTDTQRRHGRIRLGQAATYLRGDPAVVAELARSAAGRRLDLRELAPGVLVTQRDQEEVLAALRRAGESPLAEAPDGSPLTQTAKPVRHTTHPRPPVYPPDAAAPTAPPRPPTFGSDTAGTGTGRPAAQPGRAAGPPAPVDPAVLVARLRAAPTPAGSDGDRPGGGTSGNGHRHPRSLSEVRRG
jgi:Helicase conserved C-terminal domain